MPDGTSRHDTFRLTAAQGVNRRFPVFADTRAVTIARRPLLSPADRIFAMGSCFAEEIRKAMTRRNWVCLPNYARIPFDPQASVIDTLPDREHMNFYNTFTVRLQFEQMLGLWQQSPSDYWIVEKIARDMVPFEKRPVFQDPYRRSVYADTPERLHAVCQNIVAEMRRSFDEASAFIFTFGMAEVFINKASGKVAGQKPAYFGGGGLRETSYHQSTFAENLENLRALVGMIQANKQQPVPVIVSVSPVPLARTFGERDVVVANGEGKAILRAAIGQLEREFEEVSYLPSLELVSLYGSHAYEDDLRHVRPEVVDKIVSGFFESFTASNRAEV